MPLSKLPSSVTKIPATITKVPSTIIDVPTHSGLIRIPDIVSTTQLWTGFATPPIRAWQSDFGLVLGGTLLATGTTPPVVTITGSAAASIALRVEIQTTGARGASTLRYSADNGATWIESGVTTAATIALTGAAAGITVNMPAGTYTNDNVYVSTVSAWTDQITGTATFAQATVAAQPVTRVGLNSHISIMGDGVDDILTDSSVDRPAPGTTPTFYLWVGRNVTWTTGRSIVACGTTTRLAIFQTGSIPQVRAHNGTSGPVNAGGVIGTWTRGECRFGNSTSDYLKVAASSVTGTNCGNTDVVSNLNLFSDTVTFSNYELMFFALFDSIPSGAELTAFSTAATTFYGGSLAV